MPRSSLAQILFFLRYYIFILAPRRESFEEDFELSGGVMMRFREQ